MYMCACVCRFGVFPVGLRAGSAISPLIRPPDRRFPYRLLRDIDFSYVPRSRRSIPRRLYAHPATTSYGSTILRLHERLRPHTALPKHGSPQMRLNQNTAQPSCGCIVIPHSPPVRKHSKCICVNTQNAHSETPKMHFRKYSKCIFGSIQNAQIAS